MRCMYPIGAVKRVLCLFRHIFNVVRAHCLKRIEILITLYHRTSIWRYLLISSVAVVSMWATGMMEVPEAVPSYVICTVMGLFNVLMPLIKRLP